MSIKSLLAKYSDDRDLVDITDFILHWFSMIEFDYELLLVPMDYIVNIPYITIEMCQLIDKIRREEPKPNMELRWIPKNYENSYQQS